MAEFAGPPVQLSQATDSTVTLPTTRKCLYTSPLSRPNGAFATYTNLRARHSSCYFRIQAASELAATYAALILADEGIEITVRPAPQLAPRIPLISTNFDLEPTG